MGIEKINNLPEYAYQHRFIVYRTADGQKWFWGAYDDAGKALEAAVDIDGYIHDRGVKSERSV